MKKRSILCSGAPAHGRAKRRADSATYFQALQNAPTAGAICPQQERGRRARRPICAAEDISSTARRSAAITSLIMMRCIKLCWRS